MPVEAARERLAQVLLADLRRHRFPSPGLLDLTERAVAGSAREEYLSALIDKIAEVQYPSLELIRRVERLTGC